MSKLAELTKKLGEAYDKFKEAEKNLGTSKKPGIKQEFFNEATEAVSGSLAQKSLGLEAPDEEEARQQAERRNPRFRVVSVEEGAIPGYFRVLMEEDPALKDFVYVDRENKRVWTKQVVDGSPVLDEEALQAADADLWERITVPKRELRPLDELDPSDLAALEDFVYPGKPVVKLAAPRAAKPEELNEDDDQ